MNLRTKAFVAAFLVCFCSGAQAQLAWEKTQLELHPALGDATAVGVFKYENKGDKQIHFNAVRTSCGCTVAAMQKNEAAPGEKGEIKATFNIGDRTGTQVKSVTVETDDPKQPTTVLTLKAVIAQFLELQPAFVFWETGEAAKPKTIVAKAGTGVTIKNLDVASSNADFITKVEPGNSAGEFRLNVQPRDTAHPSSATLTVKPDSSPGPGKIYYASARVAGPAAATH